MINEIQNNVCIVLAKVNDLPLYGVPDDEIMAIRERLYSILTGVNMIRCNKTISFLNERLRGE